MRVFFGVPDGCQAHPTTYVNHYTWALYGENQEFICSGARFSSWQEAYDAGCDFCAALPGQQNLPDNIDQN